MERMLPNYQLFAEVSQFGDSKLLRNILDLCWEWLTVKKVKINFERLAEELELVTPEVSQFDMFGVYPAVDCATALDMMLNGITQQDGTEFINVAKISQASVARLIEHESADLDITKIKGELSSSSFSSIFPSFFLKSSLSSHHILVTTLFTWLLITCW